ncbi:UPF0489 family protein [Bacillus cereus]|uniref:UPF0489 family protein n=1 Tax=Bacillus cereus TaxID=1396 RepID=UPI0020D27811|nr:UPF0489 family protein [Bacillus cereus]
MELDNEYRICFPNKKIFISTQHNWAFSAWEIGRLRNYIKPGATVVHIDAHLDYLDPLQQISSIRTEGEAITIGSKLDIAEFIIPAMQTGTVGNVFMISNDSVEIGVDTKIERAYTLKHYEHVYRKKWFDNTVEKNVILDLDLDFFNLNYSDYNCNPVLLPEELIKNQLEFIKDSMWEWDMVTVALSPEHCGGEEVCKHIFRLFLDVFKLDLNESISW